MPAMGQIFPYVLPLRERQTVVLAWHPDHIVGPARSTNVKPIFGIAPPVRILSFFMRGGAPWRMGHCWRIRFSHSEYCEL
jgi:hypothetical protein